MLRNCIFRHGFVEEGTTTAPAFIRQADAMFRVTPLRRLRLRGRIARADRLAACPYLGWLSGLDLGRSQLDVAGLRTLLGSSYLAGLRNLAVAGGVLGIGGVQALLDWAGLSRLSELHFVIGLDAGAVTPLVASPSLRGLTHLLLDNNRFDAAAVDAIARSPHLTGPEVLGLGFNYFGPQGGHGLARSPYQGRLRKLNLSESELGDEGLQSLAGSPCLAKVSVLWIDGNNLTAAGIHALTRSPAAATLRFLNLGWHPGIGSTGAKHLASSPSLADLRDLYLSHYGIGDAGVEVLAKCSEPFEVAPAETQWDNGISDTGARALAASPYLAGLRWFNMQDNEIGAAGAPSAFRGRLVAGGRASCRRNAHRPAAHHALRGHASP